MKKVFKKIVPALLAVMLCIGVLTFVACGNTPSAEFKSDKMNFGADAICELKLENGKATFTVTIDSEGNTFRMIEEGAKRTGTYEFKDDVFTVKFDEKKVTGQGGAEKTIEAVTMTSTYDETTKTYTVTYNMPTDMAPAPVPVTLKYTKA